MAKTSIVLNQSIPLGALTQIGSMVLVDIKEDVAYVDGQRTDTVIGYKYDCVNFITFDRYVFKVAGKKPIMTNEELQKRKESGEHVMVELVNPTVKAYFDFNSKSVRDSFSADAISVLVDWMEEK